MMQFKLSTYLTTPQSQTRFLCTVFQLLYYNYQIPNMKNMKFVFKYFFCCLLLHSTYCQLTAQVGINTDNSIPDSSAILDVSSTNKGILIPRMTTAQRNAIIKPATGLTLFNLDDNCTDIYDGTTWMKNCPMRLTSDSIIMREWTQKANLLGAPRHSAVGFSINGKGYLGLGRNGENVFTDFWEYDPTTDVWTQKAGFPGVARTLAVGFSVNGKGYIGLGFDNNSNYFADFWEYDPTTDAWTQKAGFPGAGRFGATGFSINGKGYMGLGKSDNNNTLTDFWEYDPTTDAWTQKAGFPGVARFGATGFSMNGKGYLGTGYNSSFTELKDFWEYDPATNTWTQKNNLPGLARGYGSGFSINGKGYIGCGLGDNNTRLNDLWEYDPNSEMWTQQFDLPSSGRFGSVGLSIGNKGYIIGGQFDFFSVFNHVWEFQLRNTPIYEASNPFGGTVLQNAAIFDNDRDTKIQVEEVSEEDVIRFQVAGTQAMLIDSAGRVGIGVSSPNNALDVSGNVNASSFSGDGSALTNVPSDDLGNHIATQTLNLSNHNIINADTIQAVAFNGDGSGLTNLIRDDLGNHIASTNIQLDSNWLSGDGGNEGLSVDNSGKVGIGMNTPDGLLEIKGSLSNAQLKIGGTGGNANHISSGRDLVLNASGTGATPAFFFRSTDYNNLTSYTDLMIIDAAGKVGIGGFAQSNTLEVYGNASKATPGDWLGNSDHRLKTNSQQLNPKQTLDRLLSLKGITYEWNDDQTGRQRPEGLQYGFTAQNIQSVFPSLVTEDAQGYLQTAYGTYDPMYVEAIRALQNQIKVLEKENKQLKADNLDFENRLIQLESFLQNQSADTANK